MKKIREWLMNEFIKPEALKITISEFESTVVEIDKILDQQNNLIQFHQFNINYAKLFQKYCRFAAELEEEYKATVLTIHTENALDRLNAAHEKFSDKYKSGLQLFLGSDTVKEFPIWQHNHKAYINNDFDLACEHCMADLHEYATDLKYDHLHGKKMLTLKMQFLGEMKSYYKDAIFVEDQYLTSRNSFILVYGWTNDFSYHKYKELKDASHLVESSLNMLNYFDKSMIASLQNLTSEAEGTTSTELRDKLSALASTIMGQSFNIANNYNYRTKNLFVDRPGEKLSKDASQFTVNVDQENKVSFFFKATNLAALRPDNVDFNSEESIEEFKSSLHDFKEFVQEKQLTLMLQKEEMQIYIDQYENDLNHRYLNPFKEGISVINKAVSDSLFKMGPQTEVTAQHLLPNMP